MNLHIRRGDLAEDELTMHVICSQHNSSNNNINSVAIFSLTTTSQFTKMLFTFIFGFLAKVKYISSQENLCFVS